MIDSLLFRLLRSRLGSAVAASWLRRFSFALPFTRLRETASILAFEHPVPGHELHILIVPKRGYAGVAQAVEEAPEIFGEVFAMVDELVRDMGLADGGYRVVVNGGDYQDVRLLHFHLISDDVPNQKD